MLGYNPVPMQAIGNGVVRPLTSSRRYVVVAVVPYNNALHAVLALQGQKRKSAALLVPTLHVTGGLLLPNFTYMA